MSLSPYLKDLIERVVRTFLAAVFSGLATIVTTSSGTPEEIRASVFVLVTTSFTTAFAIIAKRFGNPNDASFQNEDEYGVDDVE